VSPATTRRSGKTAKPAAERRPAAKPRKTKPRPTKRDEQRDTTRARIMAAALAEFLEKSYAEAAVDSIARRAGASRATYYRYFDSKLAVAEAIFEQALPESMEFWKRFAAMKQPSAAEIAAWLDEFLGLMEGKRALVSLFRQFQAIEVKSIPEQWGPRGRIIEVLAEMPGFRRAHADASGDNAVQVRANLMLLTLWEFFYLVAVRGWTAGRRQGIRILAEEFQCFIASDGERLS
jgi:AcrR family transcriptional regulator